MSNQYFNFYYDPIRQGYDTSTWKTLFGTPPQPSSNRLEVAPLSSFVHYGDILRGDAKFSLTISAPASGAAKKFGFVQLNRNAYIYFKILNDVLTAETSDGTTTNSTVIEWQTGWSSAKTDFGIKWEAGRATFSVGGIEQAVISDASISGDPLSLYVENTGGDVMPLNNIVVKGIQSFMFTSGNEDSTFEPIVSESDSLIISESVTVGTPS